MRSNNGQPASKEADKWLEDTLRPPEPPEKPNEGPTFKHFAPGEIEAFKAQSKLRRNK